jgi:chemotaxis signal transduction protein
MPSEQREMIEGVYKLDGRLLLVLATERVLQVDAMDNVQSFRKPVSPP